MIGKEIDEIIEVLFESLLQRYQEGLEESKTVMNLFLIVLICCITNAIK